MDGSDLLDAVDDANLTPTKLAMSCTTISAYRSLSLHLSLSTHLLHYLHVSIAEFFPLPTGSSAQVFSPGVIYHNNALPTPRPDFPISPPSEITNPPTKLSDYATENFRPF